LDARGEGDALLFAVGGEGEAALLAAVAMGDELGPAARVIEGDAAAAQGVDVEGAAVVVALLLVLVEGDVEGVDLVGGEVAALELVDAGAVADGAEQLHGDGLAAVGAVEGGGEAEAVGGERAGGDEAVGGRGEVVALVADEQAEAVAVELGLGGGGVVGGDGELAALVGAAAEHADRAAEPCLQHLLPLQHEVDRGDDDQRGAAGVGDGEDGEQGLAGAGGQLDDAGAAARDPGVEGGLLVREGAQRRGQLEVDALVLAGEVVVGEPAAVQAGDDLAVAVRGGAVAAGATIEDQELGQALVFGQGAGDDEGAVIEVELEGHESGVAGGGA
jgi:hypothetical protein